LMTRMGSTFEGDGTAWSVAGNMGVPLTENGFFNLTIEYGNVDATSRSVQRADAQGLRDAGNLAVADPAQIWGAPQVTDDLKVFANFGIAASDNTRFYGFGNIARRDVLGGFFFRNPTNRPGVFGTGNTNDAGTPDDPSDDFPEPLIFDVTGNCTAARSGWMSAAEAQAAVEQAAASPDCFVFNELFPGGFTPNFGGQVTDVSGALGIKGVTDFGLSWDLSGVVGMSETAFVINNTVNASLGPDTPTRFTPGTYRQLDQTYNLDLVQPVDVGLWSPLNIALGGEFRQEAFTVVPGDTASFQPGPFTEQGGSIGSNGFPGFSQDIAGTFTRRNGAGYLDLATDIIEAWTVNVAGRYEDFDSFGDQATFKASTRLGLDKFVNLGFADTLAIRFSGGTGFRAPSPGQANVSNISTVADADGTLVNRGTIPPTNPIAVSKGGTELSPETSVNLTGGIVM
ncbi:MAG: TonB-dependent receptor, partial [Myxococcota bacterium]